MHAPEALNHESEGTGGEGNIDLVLQAFADGLTGPRARPSLRKEHKKPLGGLCSSPLILARRFNSGHCVSHLRFTRGKALYFKSRFYVIVEFSIFLCF